MLVEYDGLGAPCSSVGLKLFLVHEFDPVWLYLEHHEIFWEVWPEVVRVSIQSGTREQGLDCWVLWVRMDGSGAHYREVADFGVIIEIE